MKKYLLTFILAAIVGFIGGLQGAAGSVYVLAGLLALGIIDTQKEAAGTTLLYTSIPLTLAAAYEYYKKGKVNFKVAAVLIPTALIFSIAGAKFNFLVSTKITTLSIALTTFLTSAYFFNKGIRMK
jgi:uncharacterized membrane protein YfcA|tara:strand:- start:10 stop:387 length:378 start_codon:yes stop_codon:yes gene_type:complete